jgi:hypothetical protein
MARQESCINYNKGVNGLIGTIGAPLGDYFFGIFLKKVFKFFFNLFLKIQNVIFLRFVLKICQKYIIFKVFQVHLQVFSLF